MLPQTGDRKARLAKLIAGAAGLAAAELIFGLTVGRFVEWGRAEASLFLAFRPLLMVVAAMLAARHSLRSRIALYAAALALMAASETLLLIGLEAHNPWPEMLRGIAAGALVALVADVALQLARRLSRAAGAPVAALSLAALMLVPGALRPYEAIALGGTGGTPAAASKPVLMLMTGLPIIWGEGGAFDPNSRPAAIYRALQAEFDVRPLDTLDTQSLTAGRLLMLAQPQALAPGELADLDAWIRGGGRALVLIDPMLVWPSDLPLGDIRRPPALSLLGPLLEHWGLALEEPASPAPVVEELGRGTGSRRLAMAAPGRFIARGGQCAVAERPFLARCRLAAGRAILIADADLMRDELWAAPGQGGEARHRRLSDNPLIIADQLDALAGIERPRAQGDVSWAPRFAGWSAALLLAAIPLLLALAAAAFLARSVRRCIT